MSEQYTGILEVKNRMKDKPFKWMWDSKEFFIPAGGSLQCIEPAAWHGYSASRFQWDIYTNKIDYLVGIVGKHDVSPIATDVPTDLIDRKVIEEHDGMKSELKTFANPIARETTNFGNRTMFGASETENPLAGTLKK